MCAQKTREKEWYKWRSPHLSLADRYVQFLLVLSGVVDLVVVRRSSRRDERFLHIVFVKNRIAVFWTSAETYQMLLSLSLSLSLSTKLHPEQNGYVEWDKVDTESIDLPPSEDKYGIPSSDDEEDVGTQKDGGAGKDGASKEEGVSTAVIVDNLPQIAGGEIRKTDERFDENFRANWANQRWRFAHADGPGDEDVVMARIHRVCDERGSRCSGGASGWVQIG